MFVTMHYSGIEPKLINLQSDSELSNLPNIFFNRRKDVPPLTFLIREQNELGGYGEVWDESCRPPIYFGIMSWDIGD